MSDINKGIVKKILIAPTEDEAEATKQSVVSMMLKLSAIGLLAGTVQATAQPTPTDRDMSTPIQEVQLNRELNQLPVSMQSILREAPRSSHSDSSCSDCSSNCCDGSAVAGCAKIAE